MNGERVDEKSRIPGNQAVDEHESYDVDGLVTLQVGSNAGDVGGEGNSGREFAAEPRTEV